MLGIHQGWLKRAQPFDLGSCQLGPFGVVTHEVNRNRKCHTKPQGMLARVTPLTVITRTVCVDSSLWLGLGLGMSRKLNNLALLPFGGRHTLDAAVKL